MSSILVRVELPELPPVRQGVTKQSNFGFTVEPKVLEISRGALRKAARAGVNLPELRRAIAMYVTDGGKRADPTKPMKKARVDRQAVVRLLRKAIERGEEVMPRPRKNSRRPERRLAAAWSSLVATLNQLEEAIEAQYEASAGDVLPTYFELPLGIQDKAELVRLLIQQCGLTPREVAAIWVVGNGGRSWAPDYRPNCAPDADAKTKEAAIEEAFERARLALTVSRGREVAGGRVPGEPTAQTRPRNAPRRGRPTR